MEKESVLKQRTLINKEINEVTDEYSKLYNKTFKTLNKVSQAELEWINILVWNYQNNQ